MLWWYLLWFKVQHIQFLLHVVWKHSVFSLLCSSPVEQELFILPCLPQPSRKRNLWHNRMIEYLLNARLPQRSYLFSCLLFHYWKLNTFAICYLNGLQSMSVELCPCWHHLWSPWKSSETAAARQGNMNALIELAELPEHAPGTQSLKCCRINFSLEIICDLNAFYRLPILMTFCLMAH